jgi:acetyl-CoA C-acetyltransferase
VRPQLRVVGAVRTFEDSGAAPSPFGKPDKFPLAVARRLGVTPDHAILGKVGGDTPVSMVMELGDRILAGETEAAIAFGAEAISTTRHLSGRGETRDWAEHDEGTIDDRGLGYEGMLSAIAARHGVRGRRSPMRCSKTRGARGWACRGRTMRWKWGGCSRRSRRSPPPTRGVAPHPRR